MPTILKSALLALVALMSLMGASSAGATTWGNTGSSTFAATGGAFSIRTATGPNVSCTATNMTGTFGPGSTATPWVNAFTGTLSFSGCRLTGATPITLTCTYGFNATSHSPVVDPSPGTAGATTPGLLDLNTVSGHGCSARLGATEVCTFTGTLNATYTNPTPIAGVPTRAASVALLAGRLTPGNGSGGACPLGSSGTLTTTAVTYTVNVPSSNQPVIFHG